jgi:diguanylate cyclase (GGDEF)-like protein
MHEKNILIVDDTETNIDILLDLLGNKYEIIVATDGVTALEIIEDEEIDLVLLDIMMPNMDGYEVCHRIRQTYDAQALPIIFITARSDETSIEQAYKTGGNDYITKPFKTLELLARIKTQLTLKELIKNLERVASYDEMTGIYNRRKFFEIAIEMFKNSQENLYAIMIDIDKFKNINDTYGHPTGDRVIKAIAQTIAKNLCNSAVFGRVGGEEFAILCHPNTNNRVEKQIENIRKAVEELEIFTDENKMIKCTISEGVASATKDMKTIDALLKLADEALYEAKGQGRNRVIFR